MIFMIYLYIIRDVYIIIDMPDISRNAMLQAQYVSNHILMLFNNTPVCFQSASIFFLLDSE